MAKPSQEGLIAALATPLGQSALAVIRVSGAGCIEIIARAFSRPSALRGALGHTMVYGSLMRPLEVMPQVNVTSSIEAQTENRIVDEVMLGVFRGPKSYTGEDMVEIYGHGSVPGIERIFSLLFSLGFRQAEGGEFSLRAFLNNKMDLTQAEAVHEIVSSQSRTAQSMALQRLAGVVSGRIDGLKKELVHIMAMVSIQLDYPEDEIDTIVLPRDKLESLRKELGALAKTYRLGKTYQQGIRLALAGRTNAGKSSLFNALVREERAIVSSIHGTTRDYLEAPFVIQGIPVRLFDTAGLREVEEVIESEGIRRSGMVISSSALVLYVVDAAGTEDGAHAAPGARLHAEDLQHIEETRAKGIPLIIVWNKADRPDARPAPAMEGIPVFPVSAQTLDGLDVLLAAIAERILDGAHAEDADVIIDSERQFHLLLRAEAALGQVIASIDGSVSLDLVAMDLQDALAALGEITGEVTSEDVLDAVFSGFCVGK